MKAHFKYRLTSGRTPESRLLTARVHARRSPGVTGELVGGGESGGEDFDLHRLAPKRPLEFSDLGGRPRATGWPALRPHWLAPPSIAPASANRFQLRITFGAKSSSRLSSATVFSP